MIEVFGDYMDKFLKVFIGIKTFFFYNYFWVFFKDGIYVGCSNFSNHGVGKMLVTWNLIF